MATPIKDNKYLILDGAYRTAALKALGCIRLPVQIVKPQQFQLFTWEHSIPVGKWLKLLYTIPTLKWSSQKPQDNPLVASIMNETGTVNYASIDLRNGEDEKIDTWCKIVQSYSQKYSVKQSF